MSPTRPVLKHFTRRPQLLSAAILAGLLFGAMVPFMPGVRAVLLAFDVSIAWFLLRTMTLIQRDTVSPADIKRRAEEQEEGKWMVLTICLALAVMVVGALAIELHAARNKSPTDVALAGSTIILAWLFVAAVFAQHYAHSFYLESGQLAFPGTEHPDYWDFIYFALVISMCCQTSDVAIQSGRMRRLAIFHSVLAFFFNVIIIAIAVSVGASVF